MPGAIVIALNTNVFSLVGEKTTLQLEGEINLLSSFMCLFDIASSSGNLFFLFGFKEDLT